MRKHTDLTLVISNFNTLPLELTELSSSFIILDQSNDESTIGALKDHYPSARFNEKVGFQSGVLRRPHVGHNLLDYLFWIETHLNDSAARIAFIKGNSVPRHVSKADLIQSLNSRKCLPIFSPALYPSRSKGSEGANLFSEKNNNWYRATRRAHYFGSFDAMCRSLFQDYQRVRYVSFAPASSFLAPKSLIEKIDKDLLRAIKYILSGHFFPLEAYHVERLFPLALSNNYTLREVWRQSPGDVLRHLEASRLKHQPVPPGPLAFVRKLRQLSGNE